MHVFVPAPPLFHSFLPLTNMSGHIPIPLANLGLTQARHALFAVTVDFMVLIRLRKPASSSPVGKICRRAARKSIQQAKKTW